MLWVVEGARGRRDKQPQDACSAHLSVVVLCVTPRLMRHRAQKADRNAFHNRNDRSSSIVDVFIIFP